MRTLSSSSTLAREHLGINRRCFDPRTFVGTPLPLSWLPFILLPVLASAQISGSGFAQDASPAATGMSQKSLRSRQRSQGEDDGQEIVPDRILVK